MKRILFALLVSSPIAVSAQVIKPNREYRCDTHTMRFHANGNLQRSNPAPTNVKPVYHLFDGRTLKAFYKVDNAPNVSYSGAKFLGSQKISESGRSFEVTKFEKQGATTNRVEFFTETTPGAQSHINLIDRFSSDNFVTYGEYLSVCK